MTQYDFDFTHRENNSESQKQYEENKAHFSQQCRFIFNLLMNGVYLSPYDAMRHYGIGDLRRRKKDLKDAGVRISDRTGLRGSKILYMSKEDKEFNLKFI